MLRKILIIFAFVAFVAPSAGQAKFLEFGLNEEEVKAIIKEYLLNNPEIVKEALDNYIKKQEELRQQEIIAKVKASRIALERDPNTPVIGNPDGDVTIVEFFDYNCGYCKLMFSKVWEYVKNDGNIRWVLKDLPSLGEESALAARAGLAAQKQGKYFEMHKAMITHEGVLTEDDILAYAASFGLDMDQFEKDRKDKSLDRVLNANRILASRLEFNGIPNFIIGDFIWPGAMMGDELDVHVKAVRKEAGKMKKVVPAAVKQPVVEEAVVVEQPVIEQPVVEEAVVEEAVVVEQPVVEETVVVEQPVVEETVVVEQPDVDESGQEPAVLKVDME